MVLSSSIDMAEKFLDLEQEIEKRLETTNIPVKAKHLGKALG